MNKEEIKTKLEIAEGIDHLKEGANEFVKLIINMEQELKTLNDSVAFISGMVGYSCQAALLEKKQNYFLAKTTIGKNYIFGDSLNYYLIESKFSFYNILMGQFHNKLPEKDILDIKPYLCRVASNIANEKYLIQGLFNPEKIFDFEFYRSNWKNFYKTLIKYCKTPEEWPILFSIAMINFLDIIDKTCGKECYIIMTSIALENAIYISKILQKT